MKTKKKFGFKGKFKLDIDKNIAELRRKYGSIQSATIERFEDMPLSRNTLKGLSISKYTIPTAIQKETIGPALEGKDICGAAITGSGKTLAFLIPVLEHLYVQKWSRMDGVGAIIISPTRELAYQIFETLKNVGRFHDFSAGLVIGGKNLKFERSRMDQCNILICTPGRLLQHMDENPLFNASTMEMLVLDEADRCLDMGFAQTLNSILENFPPERQTLLFSATPTHTVEDLTRLNLHDPVYIGHSQGTSSLATPDLLQQSYVVIPLEAKITMLWSFIKNHPRQKVIVFFSTCKQVKYIYEIFCKLRPGISLLGLYGTLHQDRRIAIYNDFVKRSNVVLFATDVASRGLDFPAVNWVVQMDCPEDVNQYIHRAGRSARNKAHGESLLVLMPNEEDTVVEEFENQLLKVQKIQIDPKKLISPQAKIEAFVAQNSELKASAQRAFLTYIKSVFLLRKKRSCDMKKLNIDGFAKSLGLAFTPRIRFLERILGKSEEEIVLNNPTTGSNEQKTSFNVDKKDDGVEIESDDDFIKIKRFDHDLQDDDLQDALPPISKREKLVTKASLAKKVIKKKILINEKRKFDDAGNEIVSDRRDMQSTLGKQYEDSSSALGGIDIELSKQVLSEEDKFDKKRFSELVKKRHKQLKKKLKAQSNTEHASDDEHGDEDNGDEDDGASSVDLSWLPDPDKIYSHESAKTESSNNSNMASSSESSDSEDEPDKKKLKMVSKMSLTEAEEVATQLLMKSM